MRSGSIQKKTCVNKTNVQYTVFLLVDDHDEGMLESSACSAVYSQVFFADSELFSPLIRYFHILEFV